MLHLLYTEKRAITRQHSSTESNYISKSVSFVATAINCIAADADLNDATVAVLNVATVADIKDAASLLLHSYLT